MGTLMLVNIVFDYNADIVSVPDSIGINIKNIEINAINGYLINWMSMNFGKRMTLEIN